MTQQQKNRIVKAYSVYKSIRKVSRITSLSYGSVHAILKEAGILLPWSGFDRVNRWKGGNRGVVTRWIELHPSVVLPTKTREIARIIGCKTEDVHSWKVARWAKMKRVARKIVPKQIIKSMSFRKMQILLIDGKILGPEELFTMSKQLLEKEGEGK
jgi:hypothetical protein